jgi:hypothetical protein
MPTPFTAKQAVTWRSSTRPQRAGSGIAARLILGGARPAPERALSNGHLRVIFLARRLR